MLSDQVLGINAADWNNYYNDLSSRQVKVPVVNKSLIVCNDDETRVASPVALQTDLDQTMARFQNGRCFIRPSGTEDVVRVYAEATTQSEADELALACVEIIHRHIGVIGEIPVKF